MKTKESSLPPGERIIRCLTGEPVDRIPFGVGLGWYPTLGIMHGLDKRALALTRTHVDREVAKCRDMVKLGRYIPGFDHLIPPDASWDNFQYATNQIKEVCYQS